LLNIMPIRWLASSTFNVGLATVSIALPVPAALEGVAAPTAADLAPRYPPCVLGVGQSLALSLHAALPSAKRNSASAMSTDGFVHSMQGSAVPAAPDPIAWFHVGPWTFVRWARKLIHVLGNQGLGVKPPFGNDASEAATLSSGLT
jgi:hypothetical protein